MKIIIYRNREIYKENSKIGNDSENKVETLDFEFPEEFKEFNKYIEFQIKGEKCVDLIQNNQYVITRSIAKYGKIKTQIVLKKIVDNDTIVFKSNIFTVNVSASINASEEIEQALHVDIIQTISQNISKIESQVSNLEINKANKEEIPIVPNWAKQDNKPEYTADEITFEDGETFQEKYNIGELNGTNGKDGIDGKSAYEIALEKGFQGTVEEWITSLKGQDGIDGKDGTNGIDGINGKSAYQIWLDNGNTGTEEEFLISLKGQDGVYDDTEVKQDILEMQEEQTQQNTNIENNTTEIATLKAEKERLQQENLDFKNTLPSGAENGENLTLKDSADMTFKKLGISGNTWQETNDNMPSLDFPSTIKNCENSINFTICNKNLFVDDFRKYNRTINYFCCPIKLTAGKEYKIYSELLKEKLSNFVVGIVKDGDNYTNFAGLTIVLESTGTAKELSFVADETYTNPKLVMYAGANNFEANFNSIFENYRFQLEESNVKTNYEEHKEQNYRFPLKQKLFKTDYLAADGIHHKRTEIELDGITDRLKVSSVVKHTNNIYFCTISLLKLAINASSFYCSHLKNNTVAGVVAGNCYLTGGGGILVLVLEDQTITTAEQANEWLAQQKEAGTPVTVNYMLKEEELEEYSEEQKAIYDEIMQARSYKEKTHIFSNDEISPIFDVEYVKDIECYINSKLNAAAVAESEEA